MLTVAAIVFGLGVIVFFHEIGHLVAAKLVGLPVSRFSVGFPPHIFRKRIGETEYCVGIVPLGGYCKVDLGTTGEPVKGVPWFSRILVAVAGPFFNLVLTALILVVVYGVVGWDVDMTPPVVGDPYNSLGLSVGDTVVAVNGVPVKDYYHMLKLMNSCSGGTITVRGSRGEREVEYTASALDSLPFKPLVPVVIDEAIVGLPAYESGMRPGDSVVAVNGKPVLIWSDFQEAVAGSGGRELLVEFYRNGRLDTVRVTPVEYDGRLLAGVTVKLPVERLKLPFFRSVVEGLKSTVNGTVYVVSTLLKLFTKPEELARSSGGPIYVAEALGQQAKSGLPNYLYTLASISLAIMVFNLLPIPVLDGGHVVILLVEGVRGEPMSKKAVQRAYQVGMTIILALFLLMFFKDLIRVMTRVR